MPLTTGPIFEHLQKSLFKTTVLQGGTSCFAPNQKVVTKEGEKEISMLRINDEVLSYNEETEIDEWRRVTDVFAYQNSKRTIKLNLKNGETIICTEDHRFFYRGRWFELKELLSLKDEANSQL